MRDFLKIEELTELNDVLIDNGFDDIPMTITFSVPTREMLRKLNEDVYFKTESEGLPEEVDEIRLSNGSNITYCYQLNEIKDEDSKETVD